MKIYVQIFLLSVIIIFFACEQKTEWELDTNNETFPVITACITNELKHQTVEINYSQQEINQIPDALSGALVQVSDGTQNFIFTESEPGIYISEFKFQAVINKTYTIVIESDDRLYNASATAYPVVASEPLPIVSPDDTSWYFINSPKVRFSETDISEREIYIDWSHLSVYSDLPKDQTSALLYFYKLNTVDWNQIFPPDQKTVYFAPGSIIIDRKYSLSPAYAEYIRAMLNETVWGGGFFDPASANIQGNFDNNAKGFFAVCSVEIDTIMVAR